MDYVRAALGGLVIKREIWAQQDQRVLCEFVGRTMLRRGELRPPT
jgi:hypothetical protein